MGTANNLADVRSNDSMEMNKSLAFSFADTWHITCTIRRYIW